MSYPRLAYTGSQCSPWYVEGSEHLLIDIFNLWFKTTRSQLEGHNGDLHNVDNEEGKVPSKDVRSTHHNIGPDGQAQES